MPFKSRTDVLKESPRSLNLGTGDILEDYLKAGTIDSIIDIYDSEHEEEVVPEEEAEPEPIVQESTPAKPRWQPKKWSTKYDVIVALHLNGMTNTAIAKRIRQSPGWVSVILTSDKAKALIKIASERILAKAQSDIENRIKGTTDRALTVMDEVLNNPDILIDHPLPLFDRALSFAKSSGTLRPDNVVDRSVTTNVDTMNVNQNSFNIPLNDSMMRGLVDALSKSDRVLERRDPGLKEIASAGK